MSTAPTPRPHDAGTPAAALDGWAPGPVHSARRVAPWPAAAFADLLGTAPLGPGDPLPPLSHWFTLLEHAAHAAMGSS